jgi:7-carboxy-7-deazaguanine synthase (Cx14CxxC type)
MAYAAKEIFYTLQGEGVHTGRAAVFCRFAGCNLWSGHEQDRATAVCQFCDTDFVGTDGDGGGKFSTAEELAAAVAAKWPRDLRDSDSGRRFVVCTGGEPLLQLDPALIDALHAQNFTIAIETNGTIAVPGGVTGSASAPRPTRR